MFIFFFKQKTAYEMRISDWSSDVCSSDLIHPGDVDRDFIRSQRGVKGVILSGSHASAYQDDSLKVPTEVFEMGVPVLGICYGMQSMALQLGGKVEWSDHREFGYAAIRARGHTDRKSTRLNSSHYCASRMPSYA